MLEYFFDILAMFRHVIWVDKYIIQIDYNIDIQKVREKVIHESLEDCKSVNKTKKYYRPLEWFVMYLKSSFLFITISYVNQVVSMAKIYLCIYLSFARWVQYIRDEQEWIVILFRNIVKTTEVNTKI